MSLLEKALVFVLIGLATCNPFNNNFDFDQLDGQSPQAKQDAQMEQALAQMQSVIEIVQAKCKEAGKESIGEGLNNKLKEAFSCIQSRVNPEEIQQEFMVAARSGTITDMFKKLCTLWPQVHTCLNQLISDSKQCLDKESQHALDQTISIFDDSNTFFCENNQNRMMEFIKEGGFQCFQTVGRDISTCTKPIMEKKGNKNQQKLTYDKEDCSDFHEIRTCIMSQTSRCPSQVPGKITDDYLAIIQRVVCNSSTSLSWFSTFNLLLVVFTYFYSKMF